jgi:hypothetical protein
MAKRGKLGWGRLLKGFRNNGDGYGNKEESKKMKNYN